MTSAFTSLASTLDYHNSKHNININKNEYELFCKEFIFDRLRDETFAEAFMKRFSVVLPASYKYLTTSLVRELIETSGIISER